MNNDQDGFRLLSSSEIIGRRDEWFDERDDTWNPTTSDSWGCYAFEFHGKIKRQYTVLGSELNYGIH